MIAEVEFDKFISKDNYEKLKDMFDFGEINSRVGKERYGDNDYRHMSSGDYFKDEIIEEKTENKTTYYSKDDKSKQVESYIIYERAINFIEIEKTRFILDLDDLYSKAKTIQLKILQVVPVQHNSVADLSHTINKLQEKIDILSNTNFDFNAKCNVHVPGLGLLSITNVDYEEDMCTEELQRRLDDGWRILACCPQPNQRRPDYVFGKIEIPIE